MTELKSKWNCNSNDLCMHTVIYTQFLNRNLQTSADQQFNWLSSLSSPPHLGIKAAGFPKRTSIGHCQGPKDGH